MPAAGCVVVNSEPGKRKLDVGAPNIVVVGSINMDLVVRSSRIPRPGETVVGGSFLTAPGGKGANQAVAAARLGGHCSIIGRVGNDAFGLELLEHLRAAGVDVAGVQVSESAATGVAFIVVDETGENAISVASGANHAVTSEDIESAGEAIAGATVCLLQLELPVPAGVRAIQLCKRHGVVSILDTAPAPAPPPPAELFDAEVVTPNATEAERLTGMRLDVGDDDSVQAVAARLHEMGAKRVVLKLGSAGAFWDDGRSIGSVSAHTIQAVDTTAAGDAFTAGLGVAMARGESLASATRYANAAGAAACLTHGAQPSMPTPQQIRHLVPKA